jgi:ATP-dependent DNA helicase RecQ
VIESDQWRALHIADLRAAYLRAIAAPDRLALLRSWIRVAGGWLAEKEFGGLTETELAQADRFGLAADSFGARLRVEELDDVAEGLGEALRLESTRRRAFRPVTADAVLLRFSAHRSYQSETQKAALRALLTAPPGASLAVSMPTGSGKSLLFQVGPRSWRSEHPGACALVITPLVGLAQDHERTLRRLEGLERSRALHGALSETTREEVLFAFRRGEIPVLFMSPEIAFGRAYEVLLEAAKAPEEKLGLQARLTAVFVDEAHIIESWGRTFRPDFQRLPALIAALRDANPKLLTVLLSATISTAAREVLKRGYGRGPWLEIHAGVPRYDFDVVTRAFDNETDRHQALLRAVDLCPRPTIVYTTRVRAARDLHDELRRLDYRRLALFTGDTVASERQEVIDRWSRGDLDLIVATSAFGLGIDKGNVRSVIHACLPESAARWYQEIGRGGRDGHQALALTLWTEGPDGGDAGEALRMAASDWLTRPVAEEHWQALREKAESQWLPGTRRLLTLPLDAAPPRLGRHTGGRNRRWNMSLLNLLQRAGTLEVIAVEERQADPTWHVVLHRDELLSDEHTAAPAWDDVFALREAEKTTAVSEARRFLWLIKCPSSSNCVLVSAFSLIEPEVWDAPPCGRCAACRERARAAPHRVPSGGLNVVWRVTPSDTRRPSGRLLVCPEAYHSSTGRITLLERLARAGIQQIVVPNGWEEDAVQTFAGQNAQIGFVLPHSEWLDGRWSLADLPTAAILPEPASDADRWLRQAELFSKDFPHQRLVLVAEPSTLAAGRRLDQIASPLGSYREIYLESLVGGEAT